jgi:hypothetical protein
MRNPSLAIALVWWGSTLLAVQAAEILPGPPGGCQAVVLTTTATRLVWVTPTGLREQRLPTVLSTATVAGDRLLGFSPEGLYDLGTGDQWQRVAPAPAQPVRQALALPDGTLVCLLGGVWRQGHLEGATVRLWRPLLCGGWSETVVPAKHHPFRLRLGRTAQNSPLVLVGVRKTAVFDPHLRARPFIYTYSARRFALTPRWQGTSFAWPHRDAVFSGPEKVWALEELLTGGQRITAYHWIGYGVEGTAVSPIYTDLGHHLLPLGGLTAGLAAGQGVAVYQGDPHGGQVLALAPVRKEASQRVASLVPVATTGPLTARPAAWLPVNAGNGSQILTLCRDDKLLLWTWQSLPLPGE